MKLNFNRNLQLGYGFSILILLTVGIISYNTLNNLLDSNKAVAHSNLVIQKLESAMSVMKDAETGQRGYILTGKAVFLIPYHGAYERAAVLINEADVLTGDNHGQQRNIAKIRAVLGKRMNILQDLISKKQKGDIVSAVDLDEGRMAMDALRAAIDKAENTEHRLLDQRTGVLNRYTSVAPYAILAALALAIIIALISYFGVVREITQKDILREELQKKEEETAALNEELTAGNEELTAINEELAQAQDELTLFNEQLEQRVNERTMALAESEEETQALNEELTAINEELAAANEEMVATNEELHASREATLRNERLFRSIAVNIPRSLILVVDMERRLVTVEGDMRGIMGYHDDSYKGKFLADVAGERYETAKDWYDRMLNGEQFRVDVKSVADADLQVDFVPLKNELGVVYAGLVIALDITENKKAEEGSAKLAAIVESTDDAIISKTLDGIITSWNPSAQRMFGYADTEMIGQSILKLLPPDRLDEESLIISKLKNGDRVTHFDTQRLTSDGRIIDVSLTISPIRDAQGNITGVSKIARDISEKKRDELRKNDFIGMVSHELKTPLTSLMALVQVTNAKLKESPDSFLVGAMDKANVQVKRMSSMINGFLNVSRLESGKIAIDKEEFDLDELIREVVDEHTLTITTHVIHLTDCDRAHINADRDKISSVLSNLISNAIKYSPKGHDIMVKCILVNGSAQVSVKDEGMGIKEQDLPKIFDRYYRVETNHTRHISGFGIGLYLSAEIIRRHNGKIWAESKSGVGSTFYFSLPLG
ncbi:PAS domain S-box protein [Mucilaginibacter dorajii]|uniref:histidine kinase n=1 Tax=Mucilaginibacter dorajii TaxID=692994 RepID=A0ABP7Q3C5_9SPHI|nr:PAS domain S-box protein [Mucilaginibacter dorajii]MCS3732687.1 PAS domain S-box-containing protein [Mucilaginibacter dorajii]